MSTQDGGGIPFSIVSEEQQQHFRLFELPAELLDLITSDDPPILQLKSEGGLPGQASGAHTVLCTPDKTYNVRQVNHSNSVYIIRAEHPHDDPAGGDPIPPGVEAIAKTGSTLELNAAKDISAATYLKAALPTYASTGTFQAAGLFTKAHYFANIPASEAECERAWTDLACFELGDPAGCFLPSGRAKLMAWRSILTQALACGVDLTSTLSPQQVEQILDPSEDWPLELAEAVLRSVCVTAAEGLLIDERTCVRSVGLWSLENGGGAATSLADFKSAWADSMPEKWRNAVDIALLKGTFVLTNDGRDIVLTPAGGTSIIDGAGASAEVKATLGAKRKWHEKFRSSKKTGS